MSRRRTKTDQWCSEGPPAGWDHLRTPFFKGSSLISKLGIMRLVLYSVQIAG